MTEIEVLAFIDTFFTPYYRNEPEDIAEMFTVFVNTLNFEHVVSAEMEEIDWDEYALTATFETGRTWKLKMNRDEVWYFGGILV